MFHAWRRFEPGDEKTPIAIWLPYHDFPHVRQGALKENVYGWWIRGSIPAEAGSREAFDRETVDLMNDLPDWALRLRSRKGSSNIVMQELRKAGYHFWGEVPPGAVDRLVVVGEREPGLFDPLRHIHLTNERYRIGPPRIPHTWAHQGKEVVPW